MPACKRGELLVLKAELLFSKCYYSKGSCHRHRHPGPVPTAALSVRPKAGRGGGLRIAPRDPTNPPREALAISADPGQLKLTFKCPQAAMASYLKVPTLCLLSIYISELESQRS